MEAAAGNYADADAYIAAAIDRLDQEYRMAMLAAVRNQAFGGRAFEFLPQARLLLQNVSLIADYKVLRAMVALEAGDTAAVERECQEALDMNNGKPFQFESKTLAANYLRLIKAAGAAQ